MRQTLFFIPHEILGVPLFGVGWALGIWVLVAAALLFLLVRKQGWTGDTWSYCLVLGIVAAAIVLLLPELEARRANGDPIGLPVRGYGVFMLAGVVSGVLLAAHRAERMGVDPDAIYSLAFYMFLAGITGARLFYVVEYWEEFRQETLFATLGRILKFTEGGLVVYGSVFGALAAAWAFFRWRRLPVLAMFDLLVPSLLIGVSLGRLGCLMNGCCFGGVCDEGPSITFPLASPPYVDQLQKGELVGIRVEKEPREKKGEQRKVARIIPGSRADDLGLEPGDSVVVRPMSGPALQAAIEEGRDDRVALRVEAETTSRSWTLKELPGQSLPVHPAQIYSFLNAGLMCLLMLAWYPYRRRDGELFAALWVLYPITRILLEIVRNDEPGQFGTPLTIAQWVSVGIVVIVLGLSYFLFRKPRGSALPLAVSTGT